MITNSREQKICEKYSARDEYGFVHCTECPLRKSEGDWDFRCKANSHYDRKTKEWEYDGEVEQWGMLDFDEEDWMRLLEKLKGDAK